MKHEPALDGLRALAVVAVIFAHCLGRGGGGHGVDAFFVLSGFLITGILLKKPPLAEFYIRRARRLLPALFVLLAVYLVTAPYLFPADDARRETLLAASYFQNWSMAFDRRETGLAHTWSLAIEEQFYLFWPLVLPLLMRSAMPLRWLGAVWLLIAVLRAAIPDHYVTYYATPIHATGLIAGAMVALKMPSARYGWAGLAAILFALAFGEGSRGTWAIPLTEVGTALLIPALLQSSSLTMVFAWKPVAWIGLVSYGIYLWHWPIAYLTREHWWSLPLTAGLSVALAALSYYLIEQPIRRAKFRTMKLRTQP